MSVLGAPGDGTPSGSGRAALLVALVAAALLLATATWWLSRAPDDTPVDAVERARPAAPDTPAPTEDEAPAAPEATAKREARREPRPTATPAPSAPTPPAGPVLRVDSDVPGAFVFVDRKFVGETPLETREVTPGSHQVNVSAEGYDGVSRTVEVADSGPTDVSVELKTVRLDESVDVVHKHGFGSCEGRLVAALDGIRYQTTNTDDVFKLPFSAIETFEVDYLDKNLRVKERGGRTWNFTTESENADPLFVFHREVEQAREKLARR